MYEYKQYTKENLARPVRLRPNNATGFSVCLELICINLTFSQALTLYAQCVNTSAFTRDDTVPYFYLKDGGLGYPIRERITYTRDMRPSKLDDTLLNWVKPNLN